MNQEMNDDGAATGMDKNEENTGEEDETEAQAARRQPRGAILAWSIRFHKSHGRQLYGIRANVRPSDAGNLYSALRACYALSGEM
ncbi:MAG: hypothetical protein OJF49_002098 [Ktedonobacterales bacterium]|jgi:hypothetical protein|nr:MAG: hypothetical protein OJF49_002098 [Ktedonobacterales bacterium]